MIRILANSRCLDDKVNVSEKKKEKIVVPVWVHESGLI